MNLPIYEKKSKEDLILTKEMKDAFEKDGFIIVKNLFSIKEMEKLKAVVDDANSPLMKNSYVHPDGDGGKIRMVLWNQPGNDVTGVMSRSNRIVDTCEWLIGGEVFHYHSKCVLKEAYTGGTFQWHQDYGYWYLYGILAPNMISVQLSIDPANRKNGCLQIIRGSHKLGRVDHKKVGEEAGADMERVNEILKKLERVYVESESGDALFFHCNLLHRSDCNKSDIRRYNCLFCYNRADNDAVKKHHHSSYVPLQKVGDDGVINCKDPNNVAGKDFFNPGNNFADKLPKEEATN